MKNPATILLVEDNETNLILFQDVLQLHGYTVRVARNGFEALAILEEWVPDLILMDIYLPELDGLSVIRTIRSKPGLAHIKIIGFSALAMESDIEKAMEAGCNRYLTKPIDLQKFLEEVEQILQN